MRLRTHPVAILACLLSLASQASAQNPGTKESQSAPVLSIDSAQIAPEEFAQWMLRLYASRHAKDFVDQWVIHREAKARGLEVPQADIFKEMDEEIGVRIDGAFHGKKEEWLGELSRLGRTEGGHRRQREVELRPWIESREMVREGRVVPELLIERDWELYYGPRGRRFELQLLFKQIVFSSMEAGTPNEILQRMRAGEEQAVLAQIQSIRKRIVDGGEDFGVVARETSDDEDSREFAGRWPGGWNQFGWPSQFVDALFDLQPGEVSEPLRARGGWWLVKVESFQDTPLETVREKIVSDLIVKGPEQSEVGNFQVALLQNVTWELSPEMFAEGEPAEGPPLEGLVIDGTSVSRAEFARWFLAARGETMYQQFAEHWLVEKTAREQLISVSLEELEARTDEFLGMQVSFLHKGNREAWQDYVRKQGRTEDDWRREWRERVRIDLLTEKLLLRERVVTDEMVRAHWEDVYGKQGREIRARWIVFGPPQITPEPGMSKERFDELSELAHAQRLRDAQELVQRIRAGEDFATLARKYSEDPATREQGGELDGRFRPESWPEEVAREVPKLKVGEVSEPFFAARCFMIFEVFRERTVQYAEVEAQLREDLKTKRPANADLAGWRNALLKKSKVTPMPGIYAR